MIRPRTDGRWPLLFAPTRGPRELGINTRSHVLQQSAIQNWDRKVWRAHKYNFILFSVPCAKNIAFGARQLVKIELTLQVINLMLH